jgi:RNA polymerase sigma-70 factor, ECF subfamily
MNGPEAPHDEDAHEAARELMRRVQQKDETAFQELYDTHCHLVYSIAANMLPTGNTADEIVQEVFLKIWNASNLYDAELGKVVSWIITMTRRFCLNRIRSENRRAAAHTRAETEIQLTPHSPAADGMLLLKEDALAVRAAVALLPQDQQDAIRLSFFENMTHENAADALKVPLGTLKARIRRGMLKLRDHLPPVR